MEKTTIQINIDTLEKLKSLKHSERQSYDDVLNGLIDNCEEESLSEEEIDGIKIALEEVRRGEVYPIEHVAKELSVKLR
ncbi:MAG: hypothetical protein BWY36_00674 [Candidatus Diapherotrites archaeon ADurb.Bin253]|jgi:predicted CopG family antitoxin|nr:MAG: hypothetical protein BWY36_00674 [Candidatus Diapherotrites archaeon ADurb.Bin253]HNZ52318.1 hypothetical protein [Candidatus Pacearchaeota archaeon]HOH04394.1 hypothetical protein [Candidatus Pacearchaeota archaeon]